MPHLAGVVLIDGLVHGPPEGALLQGVRRARLAGGGGEVVRVQGRQGREVPGRGGREMQGRDEVKVALWKSMVLVQCSETNICCSLENKYTE